MNDSVSHPQWIEAALARYEAPLMRCAQRVVGDPETSRDVVQDTFLKLCKASREKVEDHLAAWLFTVCRNRALDVLRKEGRMSSLEDVRTAEPVSPAPLPSAEAAKSRTREVLLDAVRELPPAQKEVFLLKFQEDLSYREIAGITGKSLGTVSKLITTALASIRERMVERGEVRE